MGFSMPNDKEVYSLEEIIKAFDPKRIGVSGAYFDTLKLDWLNQQYLINSIPQDQLWNRMKQWMFNDAFMDKLIPLCHTRIKTFGEFMELCGFFFINHLHYTEELLCPGGTPKEKIAPVLQGIIWSMDEQENWKRAGIEKAVHDVQEIFGVHLKKVVIPLFIRSTHRKETRPSSFRLS